MKNILFAFCFLVAIGASQAQNLVPNPGFENFSTCPTSTGQIVKVVDWHNYAGLTPDYFNSCSVVFSCSVPSNAVGTQTTHGGNGYTGIFAYQFFDPIVVREYITTKLIQPLQPGTRYWVKFYTSLADGSMHYVNRLGAYFSQTSTLAMDGYLVTEVPQVQSDTAVHLSDKVEWIPITGSFIANGTENYLTIGHFHDDDPANIQNTASGTSDHAYYLIDDVFVSSDSLTVANQPSVHEEVDVYPSPFKEFISVRIAGGEEIELTVHDIKGYKIIDQKIGNGWKVNTEDLPKGLFFYEVRRNGKVLKKGKVLKN